MKILFSPSETKNQETGNLEFKVENLLFGLDPRKEFLNSYDKYVQNSDVSTLSKLFGLKKESEILELKSSYKSKFGIKAVKRYTGVAYDALNYENLDIKSQNFIDKNTLIFSNLYGVLLAGDIIPNYKLKQGESIGSLKPEIYYNTTLKSFLDEFLDGSEILDLRAGFYSKFYKTNNPVIELKFLKDSKIISHWAKFYRGLVLREMAKAQISSFSEFYELKIENLSIKEIKKSKNRTIITYEIDYL